MMSTTSGSQPMTSRPSWRSISEIWDAQAADAVDHVVVVVVVVGAVVDAVAPADPPALPLLEPRPPGQSAEDGLTR